jgi:hypothetical protein
MRRSPKERHSAHQACRCKGPCHCDGQCVGPCPCDHTAVDLHVELHEHLDRALRCMDQIQDLETAEPVASLRATSWPWTREQEQGSHSKTPSMRERLAQMKDKAVDKLKQLKERLSGKKKKSKSGEEAEGPEADTVQSALANLYLVHERY